MVTEWDLVCDNGGYVELMQSLMFVGNGIGAFFWTYIADRYSRKYAYIISLMVSFICELGLLFSQGLTMAMVLRFFSGTCTVGMMVISFVVREELFTSNLRLYFSIADSLWYSISLVVMYGGAYFLRYNSWRDYQLLTVVLFTPAIVLSFFGGETLVWYFAKGRHTQAKHILSKAAKMNRKNIDNILDLFDYVVSLKLKNCEKFSSEETSRLQSDINNTQEQNEMLKCKNECTLAELETLPVIKQIITDQKLQHQYSLLDIVRHKQVLIVTITMAFSWMTTSFCYYGIFLSSSALVGDRYLNNFLLVITDFPGYIVQKLMVNFFGRRRTLVILFTLCATSLFISAGLASTDSNESKNASTAFFILGKFTITIVFNIIYFYTAELYPTPVRSMSLGVCLCAAQIGNIFSPYLRFVFMIATWGPGLIIGIMCLACAIFLKFVPETEGRDLPNTFAEISSWKKNDKRCKDNQAITTEITTA